MVGLSNAIESPVCPCAEQIVVALVRLARRAEARELAHGEHAPAIHVGVDAARVRVLAREREIARQVHAREVLGRVERPDRNAGDGVGIDVGRFAWPARSASPRPRAGLPRPPRARPRSCRNARRWRRRRLRAPRRLSVGPAAVRPGGSSRHVAAPPPASDAKARAPRGPFHPRVRRGREHGQDPRPPAGRASCGRVHARRRSKCALRSFATLGAITAWQYG